MGELQNGMSFAALPAPLYDKRLFGWRILPIHKLFFNLSFQYFRLRATFSNDFCDNLGFFRTTFCRNRDFFKGLF